MPKGKKGKGKGKKEQAFEVAAPQKETADFPVTKITESLLGLCALYPDLGVFKFGNVVVQRNYPEFDAVRVISGGASGFEPLNAGYVGKGMLIAAIQGENYTSPPIKLIVRTLRELNYSHEHGLLLIVQGNSGDQISFTLATTKAKNENIRMKLMLVADSCINKDLPCTKKQCLAGVVLIYKIAGAMADNKELLKDVYQYCEKVLENMSSSIISKGDFRPQTEDFCICRKKRFSSNVSIGKGFQGEPGKDIAEDITINNIIPELIKSIFEEEKFELEPGCSVIVLLSNVGKFTKQEELILVRDTIIFLQEIQVKVAKFYCGPYLTAKDYMGISLTILKLFDDKLLEYLDHPCTAPAWVSMCEQKCELNCDSFLPTRLKRKIREGIPKMGPNLTVSEANTLVLCTKFACEALISCENQLNIIDAETGDGDTGSRLKTSCEVVLNRIKEKKMIYENPFAFFDGLASVLETLVGGTMGSLYGIFFRTISNYFAKIDSDIEITANHWIGALEKSLEVFKMPCVNFGDSTMYDPLYAGVTGFREELDEKSTPMEAFTYGILQGEEAIIENKRENQKYPDAGAHAVGIWFRAILEAIKIVFRMSGVEVITEDLSDHPQCPHGPTILFSKLHNGEKRNFFACSACRDRKHCNFFLWQDELSKVLDGRKEAWEEERNKFIKNINHIEINKKFQKIFNSNKKIFYCHKCKKIENQEKVEEHKKHEHIENLTKYQLKHPSEVLLPLDDAKKEAQFLFAKSSIKDIVDIIKDLKYSKVLCIGTPRIHEFIKSDCEGIKSLLLDIDDRFHYFYNTDEFCWYNSFNHHFFFDDAKKVFEDFIKINSDENLILITDPPFGGRVEPLAQTFDAINKKYKTINNLKKDLPIIWAFPYFMEPQIKNSLQNFQMSDYKVEYDNHPLFQDGSKGRKHGSPVRIFTNIDLKLIKLPDNGYKYCDFCEKWVSNENNHCYLCNDCTSKDGRTYVHCKKCQRCVKPTWQHCIKCNRCAVADHRCGDIMFLKVIVY
ncbi:unnamed protein product [Brassicogethes aeneus]|uniref:Triokinase/FMN cyclase n=1 Tax=Brassicogethes aeneus TaxID=1431903 RepID=A0A9P0BEN8_BRAAE|nr:unnamed protein product [Brassicogethes aeneus]